MLIPSLEKAMSICLIVGVCVYSKILQIIQNIHAINLLSIYNE